MWESYPILQKFNIESIGSESFVIFESHSYSKVIEKSIQTSLCVTTVIHSNYIGNIHQNKYI